MTVWICAPGRQPSPMDPMRPLRARQRLSSHRTARPPSRCRQDPIVVEATEVLPAAVREEKQMKWDVDDRAVIMLRQVSFSGTRAWLTLHANVKGSAEHQYNRKEEWKTITTLLKSSEAFKTFAWPNDEQAIIQWIDRQLKLFKHLWTPGMEQNEPAEAGTEGTKDETALTEFQQLLMEIDAHKKEAERITAENKAGKDKASELSATVGKAMQDQLVGKKYGEGVDHEIVGEFLVARVQHGREHEFVRRFRQLSHGVRKARHGAAWHVRPKVERPLRSLKIKISIAGAGLENWEVRLVSVVRTSFWHLQVRCGWRVWEALSKNPFSPDR